MVHMRALSAVIAKKYSRSSLPMSRKITKLYLIREKKRKSQIFGINLCKLNEKDLWWLVRLVIAKLNIFQTDCFLSMHIACLMYCSYKKDRESIDWFELEIHGGNQGGMVTFVKHLKNGQIISNRNWITEVYTLESSLSHMKTLSLVLLRLLFVNIEEKTTCINHYSFQIK